MKSQRELAIIFILGLGIVSIASVAKKQDPIVATQTDPVRYQDVEREKAEGKKGPPVPSLIFFPEQDFLIEPPVGAPKAMSQPVSGEGLDWDLWLGEDEEEEEEGGEFKMELDSDDTWEDAETGGEDGAFLTP